MLLLFELGIFFSGWFVAQKAEVDKDSADADDTDDKPMTEAEMDAELDRIEAGEDEH